jgi:hypothetical protein
MLLNQSEFFSDFISKRIEQQKVADLQELRLVKNPHIVLLMYFILMVS